MSNYYVSKCCKVPADIIDYSRKLFYCKGCESYCQVTAMLDTPGGVPKEDTLISKQAVLDLIVKEILVCHHENTPTSRLTSLYNSIHNML